MNNVIYIASGKGGVGKTTVCANLGAALADVSNRVLVVDADITLRNLDIILGLQDSSLFDSQDILLKRCDENRAFMVTPINENLFFLPAPTRLEMPAAEMYTRLFAYLSQKSAEFDYILVDCPSGTGFLRYLKDVTSKIICVTTPDSTAVRDAGKLADLAALKEIDGIKLIINRVSAKNIKKGYAPDIGEILERVDLKLLGIVPEDPKVTAFSNLGKPIFENKKLRISRAFANIAARTEGKETDLLKYR